MQNIPTKVLAEFSVLIFCYLFNFFTIFKLKFFNGFVASYFERFEEYPVIFCIDK